MKVFVKLTKKIDDSYYIHIGNKITKDFLCRFFSKKSYSKIGIVTDSNVYKLYSSQIKGFFTKDIDIFSFTAGEENKSIDTINTLTENLLKSGFDRKSILIAFGGGVTGDITGFLASIYMRGIRFIQIPTTLLSMVDSSIGGKTGVDTNAGKNLIGTFYQPKMVIIDPEYLYTLPEIEILNGFAEIIKHGIIFDKKYFETIEKLETITNLEMLDTSRIIKRSCEIKSYVVKKDEKESGLRQILNFGHTVGHALEKIANFSIPHGICVAIGMLIESCISKNKKILNLSDYHRIENVLEKFSYLNYFNKIKNLLKIFKTFKNIFNMF